MKINGYVVYPEKEKKINFYMKVSNRVRRDEVFLSRSRSRSNRTSSVPIPIPFCNGKPIPVPFKPVFANLSDIFFKLMSSETSFNRTDIQLPILKQHENETEQMDIFNKPNISKHKSAQYNDKTSETTS